MALCAVATMASCATPTAGVRGAGLTTTARATFLHAGFGAGPVVFTDDTGHLTEERRYEPFGAPIDAHLRNAGGDTIGAPDLVARDLNPLNKRSDPATGWSDHGERWLAPETGRWLSPDPAVVGPDSELMAAPWALHPYQYVDQNPVAFWDPDGRQAAPALSPTLPPTPPPVPIRPPLTLVPPAPPPAPGVFARLGTALSNLATPLVVGVAAGVTAFFYDESVTGGPNDSCQHGCAQTSSVPAPKSGPRLYPLPKPDGSDRKDRPLFIMSVQLSVRSETAVDRTIQSPKSLRVKDVNRALHGLIYNNPSQLAIFTVNPISPEQAEAFKGARIRLGLKLQSIADAGGIQGPGVVATDTFQADHLTVTISVSNVAGHNLLKPAYRPDL